MKPARLRALIRKYGNLGVLLAGLILWQRSLSLRNRVFISLFGLTFITGGLLLLIYSPSPKPSVFHAGDTAPTIPKTAIKNEPNPAENTLLAHATKIADVSSWSEFDATSDRFAFHHQWLSDHEVVFVRELEKKEDSDFIFFLYDVAMQKETKLQVFSRRMQKVDNSYGELLSPDRRELLAFGSRWRSAEAVAIDGSPGHPIHPDGNGVYVWLKDSQHYVYLSPDFRRGEDGSTDWEASLYGRNNRLRKVLKPIHTGVPFTFYCELIHCGDHFVIVPQEARLNYGGETVNKLDVYESGLGLSRFPERKHTIHFPFQAEIRQARLSPNGNSIAVLLEIPAAAKGDKTSQSRKDWSAAEIWVSRIDGSGLHKVGRVTFAPQMEEDAIFSSDILRSLEWLPDGKRLGFLHGDALYTVLAD